jgi:hypothetical protein
LPLAPHLQALLLHPAALRALHQLQLPPLEALGLSLQQQRQQEVHQLQASLASAQAEVAAPQQQLLLPLQAPLRHPSLLVPRLQARVQQLAQHQQQCHQPLGPQQLAVRLPLAEAAASTCRRHLGVLQHQLLAALLPPSAAAPLVQASQQHLASRLEPPAAPRQHLHLLQRQQVASPLVATLLRPLPLEPQQRSPVLLALQHQQQPTPLAAQRPLAVQAVAVAPQHRSILEQPQAPAAASPQPLVRQHQRRLRSRQPLVALASSSQQAV